MSLVPLHAGFRVAKWDQLVTDERRLEVLQIHVDVRDRFEIEEGWNVMTKADDKRGKYPMALGNGDHILELSQLPDII